METFGSLTQEPEFFPTHVFTREVQEQYALSFSPRFTVCIRVRLFPKAQKQRFVYIICPDIVKSDFPRYAPLRSCANLENGNEPILRQLFRH